MGLDGDEIAACREAFAKFDKDGSGTIDTNELKATLQSMGQNPTEEELFQMISQVRDVISLFRKYRMIWLVRHARRRRRRRRHLSETLDSMSSCRLVLLTNLTKPRTRITIKTTHKHTHTHKPHAVCRLTTTQVEKSSSQSS